MAAPVTQCVQCEGAASAPGGEPATPCAFCYCLHGGNRSNICGRDGCPRSYCSAACQSSDWQSHGHDQWCGKSAERDAGYRISGAGMGRGEGVYSLRHFVPGDRIMVERKSLGAALGTPVGSAALLALPAGVKAALTCLSSATSEDESAAIGDQLVAAMLQRKFTNNSIGLGDADRSSGLFLTIAKVNHSCAGNSEHYYLEEHGLMLLVATTNIAVGDEITFSYVHESATQQQRAEKLQHWGIVCDCRACVVLPGGTGSVCKALDKIARLDAKLVAQGSCGRISKALATGQRLLDLYEQSGLGSLMLCSRTNFDMFGLASLEPSMRAEAKQYLQASCKLDATFFGRSDLEICQSKRALLAQAASSGDESGRESDGEDGSSEGGSVEDDGRTSDEDEWPRACAATVVERIGARTIDSDPAGHTLAAHMSDDGAAMIQRVLPSDACATAKRALLYLRDECNMSHLFSSPMSNHAPPCAAECVWLCDAAFAAMERFDGAGGGSEDGGGAGAIRRAVDACAGEARRALKALGYDPADACQLGLPMASVGLEAAQAERFHCGHEAAPALHHQPLDGLDAQGSRASTLILTSTLVLEGRRSESAVQDVAAQMAVLRTHVAASRAVEAPGRADSKRRRVEDAHDGQEVAAHNKEATVVEISFQPEAGDVLLIPPHTPRSLSGGRVSITLWWQLSNAAADQRAAALTAVPSTITPAATSTSASASNIAPTTALAVDAKSTPVVFDGVLSHSVREALGAMPPVRFGVYDRSCPPSNAHEELIESLLEQLGDHSRYIEYWGRAVWRAVPAHSDLDEIPLLATVPAGDEPPRPRFPLWAHVVYLDIAGGVAAPTVVWDDEHSRSRHVVVIPAVPSRLLRFCGSWVHAVPKPAAEHLGEEQTEAEELDEEARGGVVRHVLLFNSWPDAPPVGQPSRPTAGTTEVVADDGAHCQTVDASEQAATKATPFDQWRPSLIVQHGGVADGTPAAASAGTSAALDVLPSTTALVARLMGGARRRGRSVRYRCDALEASREAVYDALYEPVNPSSFCVR